MTQNPVLKGLVFYYDTPSDSTSKEEAARASTTLMSLESISSYILEQ